MIDTWLNQLLLNPEYHDFLAIVKGIRNGAVYGAKIRFPHALVMTFLFRDGTFEDKMRFILKATYQHSRNLATFVPIYKSLLLVQRKLNQDKEHSMHAFIAGIIGGYIVFGENNNINQQINLYLLSRILVGGLKLMAKRGYFEQSPFNLTYQEALNHPAVFPVFASVTWGVVMWLFRHERETLQPSLQASMQYLYNDSDKWSGFKNWLWHNK